MRITGVESTDLFTGGAGRPLQIIRITVTGEPGDHPLHSTVRVAGNGISQPEPFRIERDGEDETRTVGVGVEVADYHRPGTSVPVTVLGETGPERSELTAMITLAEPGWTMWMVSHFHYDPVWWSSQRQFTEAQLVLLDED